ncbi:cyclin-dependent kinase 8/11 [Patellaria atrata CBS 101060]|uniref:Cyclin-dependent kinase 8/11 n=1 Tax=Patellaria atrata CBS 101060 TaxID=1346257 RepID=A0A9P4SG00_9PEZI|nr:cyclin-dependent kinase 8/11 [Patellaria atrata CBS 101060]
MASRDDDDYSIEDDDAMKEFFPTSFGKQSKGADVQAQIDKSRRQLPTAQKNEQDTKAYRGDSDEEDEDEDEDDDDDEDDEFPVSHELIIKTHERAITTATIDPSGSRLVTGSTDCTLKLHDFASMTPSTIRSFRSVDPSATKGSSNAETHPVHQVAFNPLSPGQMLVVTALPQAKIFSRDGDMLIEFVKGDMYLRDMHNTKGHVSEVTAGTWHPTNRDLCVTAGTDSTLRIWDVNNRRGQRDVIVHKSRAAGSAGRTRMTAVAWGASSEGNGSVLVGAALDGSLVMWGGDGPYTRPAAEIRDAHVKDTWTGGLDISRDGRLVITRGGDDTIKLWDTRKFKAPITTVSHPSTSSQYPTSNIRFSPTSSNVITGSETGHLHILNPATLRPELVTPIALNSSVITVLWHEKLNQIITGSANGETHVLYNPTSSTLGAKMVMSKAPKRRHIDDDPNLTMDLTQGLSGDSIITPGGALTGASNAAATFAARHPTIGLTASGKSRDPRRPHVPAVTPFAKSQPDAQHIKKNIPLSSMRDEDPRAALLRYADKATKEPLFTSAWSETQPRTLYAELSDEEEGPASKKTKR